MLKYNFVETLTPRKFIIAKLSIRNIGSSIISANSSANKDEDPSLRIESFAILLFRFHKILFQLDIHHENLQGTD